jgi:hypothetical protein
MSTLLGDKDDDNGGDGDGGCPYCGEPWGDTHERRRTHLEEEHSEEVNEDFDEDNTQGLRQRAGYKASMPWLGEDDEDEDEENEDQDDSDQD